MINKVKDMSAAFSIASVWEKPFSQTEAMEKAEDISAEVDDS
jgi:hypothetical protein